MPGKTGLLLLPEKLRACRYLCRRTMRLCHLLLTLGGEFFSLCQMMVKATGQAVSKSAARAQMEWALHSLLCNTLPLKNLQQVDKRDVTLTRGFLFSCRWRFQRKYQR